jgi:hypothetical protein
MRRDAVVAGSTLAGQLYSYYIQEDFGSIAMSLQRSRARTYCLRAAIDVIQFRNRTGEYPRSLVQAGVTELDPFTGKELGFRVDGKGFRVYSVGVDGVDDGGATREERQGGQYDEALVFDPDARLGN